MPGVSVSKLPGSMKYIESVPKIEEGTHFSIEDNSTFVRQEGETQLYHNLVKFVRPRKKIKNKRLLSSVKYLNDLHFLLKKSIFKSNYQYTNGRL